MRHYGRLENPPFIGPLYIHTKASREKLLQKNHKHGSSPKDFNKIKYISKNTGSPQAKISCPLPKVISVWFDDPYNHIHHTEHTHENNHPIDTQEPNMENNEVKQYELYDKKNDELITRE